MAIFCADTSASENCHWQLENTIAALGLRVQCHVRQWRFAELGEPLVFEQAVDHALDADLVVIASHEPGLMPEDLQAVLADWLIRSGGEASPLAIVLDCGASGKEVREEILAALRRLTDRAHVPLYTHLGDALLVAWDLWEWKHFPWAAATEDLSIPSRIDGLAVGQRHPARRCR